MTYYERKAAGLCVEKGCAQACDGETIHCAQHRARRRFLGQRRLMTGWRRKRHRRYCRRYRRQLYARGLCSRCGAAPHDPDSFFCLPCEDQMATYPKGNRHAKAAAAPSPAARRVSASAAG